MPKDPKILAAIEAVAVDLLPPAPQPGMADDGNDWMASLHGTGWTPVPTADDGRPLGMWPYQIIAHHDDTERGLYGLAVYSDGDVRVDGYWDQTARDQDSNTYAEE